MTYKIQTPQEVWKDYDAKSEPLREECIFESAEVNRARTVKDYVFSGEMLEDGEVKVFCRVVTPIAKKGVVIFTEDYEPKDNQTLIDRLAEEGWAVFLPDYGDRMNCGTKFPLSVSYGKLSVGRDRLFRMKESPRDTCQFLYEKILKRTLTFAKKLYPDDKTVMLGFGLAAELAAAVAGSDDRIDGLVLVNGGLYREYLGRNRFEETSGGIMDDHTVSWMSGVASAAYAKNVSCPTLLIAGTNSSRFDCDRLQTIQQLLKRAELQIYLTAGGAETVDSEGLRTLLGWLELLSEGARYREVPDAKIRFEDGVYSVYVRTDTSSKAESVRVYYAFDEYDHKYRNWRDGAAKSISDQGEYLFAVPSEGYHEALFVFAEVCYPNGTLSSIVHFSDEKPENRECVGTKLVLSAKDCGTRFRAESDEEILTLPAAKEAVTKTGLIGVTSEQGALVTYVLNEKRELDEDAVLQINFFTEKARKILIRAVAVREGISELYSVTAEILGASEAFTAASFPPEAFKNVEMLPMESWDGVKSLAIEAKGAIIGNILFI